MNLITKVCSKRYMSNNCANYTDAKHHVKHDVIIQIYVPQYYMSQPV